MQQHFNQLLRTVGVIPWFRGWLITMQYAMIKHRVVNHTYMHTKPEGVFFQLEYIACFKFHTLPCTKINAPHYYCTSTMYNMHVCLIIIEEEMILVRATIPKFTNIVPSDVTVAKYRQPPCHILVQRTFNLLVISGNNEARYVPGKR